MIPLRLADIRKSFARRLVVDISSLEVEEGEILAMLGPSGCGKSTTLRMIAGLETPDSGRIEIGEALVANGPRSSAPDKRNVGMVFQDYALFPHLTVAENILYGLRRSKDRRDRLEEMINLVGLAGLNHQYPRELSGGQQQRVALARALAPRPSLLLLDEPFSSLDQGLRQSLRSDVRHIIQQTNTTAILVTHDQEEALSIADRVAVMLSGRIAQIDHPAIVYLQPATVDVATFMGEANLIPGFASSSVIETPLGSMPNPEAHIGHVLVMVRPEFIEIALDAENGEAVGTVESVRYFGHDHLVTVEVDGIPQLVQVRLSQHVVVAPKQRVSVSISGPTVIYTQ